MVKSKEMYSTQSYCVKFLDLCPITDATQDELRDILDELGYNLWDYPLDEIDHIVENELDVVLVDTTYVDSKIGIVPEYRWFEIPKEE